MKKNKMTNKIIALQKDGLFSVTLYRDDMPPYCFVKDDSGVMDYLTWLHPATGLHEQLANNGLAESDIEQILESLRRGGDASLEFFGRE